MAAALLERHAQGAVRAQSAGSAPARSVHPVVVDAMARIGIDLSAATPRSIADVDLQTDIVVTMGCGDACPVIPGARIIDWSIEDPAELPIDDVERIRDDLERRVIALRDELLA